MGGADRQRTKGQPSVGGELSGVLGAAFLTARRLTAAFLTAAFFTATFLTGISEAGLLTGATFAFGLAVFGAGEGAAASISSLAVAVAVGTLSAIRKDERSRLPAIHPGGLPKPVHVFPVFGSLYFGTPAPARAARLTGLAVLAAGLRDWGVAGPKRSSGVNEYSSMVLRIRAITLEASALRSRAACD